MRKSNLVMAIAMMAPFMAHGARIVSGPLDSRATHCGWVLDAGAKKDVPVALSGADKICELDVSTIASGNHTVTATAVAIDPAWGRLESAASVPFAFARPNIPAVPTSIRLMP